jgi:hypothetical protein
MEFSLVLLKISSKLKIDYHLDRLFDYHLLVNYRQFDAMKLYVKFEYRFAQYNIAIFCVLMQEYMFLV